MSKICKICGKEFEPTNPSSVYCSLECAQEGRYRQQHDWYVRVGKKKLQEYKVQLEVRKCRICGKEFMPKSNTNIYCSTACKNKGRYNKSRAIVQEQPPVKKLDSISAKNELARSQHKTYGQLQAEKLIAQMKWIDYNKNR